MISYISKHINFFNILIYSLKYSMVKISKLQKIYLKLNNLLYLIFINLRQKIKYNNILNSTI